MMKQKAPSHDDWMLFAYWAIVCWRYFSGVIP